MAMRTITRNIFQKSHRHGQAMLLAVLAIGGAILGATAIAGLLMLYQIRATNDSANSASAIFAADAGVEWSLFDFYCALVQPTPRCTTPPSNVSLPYSNNASTTVTCYDASGTNAVACSSTSTAQSAISKGSSLNSRRAFFLMLTGATTTYP